jgi:palmitoyl-protein thioesterase
MKINGGDPCITIGYCPMPAQAHSQPAASSDYRPFVIMHGHASSASSMNTIVGWVIEDLPGILVRNIEIGDGTLSAIFMSLNKQVANFAGQLAADPALQNGFNMLGYSQGALITRGFIERFNYPQTYNWISLAGPDAGQFGLGHVPEWLWGFLQPLLRRVPYCWLVQHTFAFAQYWKNPYNVPLYAKKSAFLADVNNEKATKNDTYKANLLKLNQAVLMFSDTDDVIRPTQSGWFEFFAEGQEKTITPLRSSEFYLQDFIGIKALDDSQRLFLFETDCLHDEHHTEPCKDFFYEHGIPFVNNSFT